MNRFGLAIVVCGLAVGVASAASPDPKDLAIPPQELSKARELVRRLASEDYDDREDAHKALAKMGRLARPVLAEAALSDTSAEVRSRASRLLPRAEAEELKARIDTFLADAENKYEHDLPGWKTFRVLAGQTKSAQALFVEMLQGPGNLEILVAMEQSDSEAGKAIADRRTAIYLKAYPQSFGRAPGVKQLVPQPPTLADVATLLFAEVAVDAKHIPRSVFFQQMSVANFLQQSSAMSAANGTGGPQTEAFRILLAKWLDTRTHPDDLSNYSVVNAANMFRTYPESTPLLRRVVTTDGVQGYMRSQALMHLIQKHGKDETPFLRSLVIGDKERSAGGGPGAVASMGGLGAVADRSLLEKRYLLASNVLQVVWLGGNNVNAPIQLRDYALSILIVQSGQNLKDYGFDFPPGNNQIGNQVNYPNYAFANEEKRSTEEKREAAIAKWRAWEANMDPPGVKANPFRQASEVYVPTTAPAPNFRK